MLLAAEDLVPLRSDPRWRALVDQDNANGHPCRQAPEFRQFDYWLGEWDIEIGGVKRAQSSIQLILDECVVFENYSDARGYAGKSFPSGTRRRRSGSSATSTPPARSITGPAASRTA